MRQAVIVAPDRFEVRDADVPAGAVVLRTALCGICSGDLMPWYLAKKVGTVFGHEPVGHAVSSDVPHVQVGDLVFVHHHAPCKECDECRRGAFVHCPTWKASRLDPGGMAERIGVPLPIARHDCFAVNDLTPEQALFIEPLGCCVKALNRANPRGLRVGVVGCGVMGLLNLMAARAYQAAEVVAVEPDPVRREAARTAGAGEALTPETAARTLRHTLDAVIIGPGHPDVIRQALDYVRPDGTAVLFTPTAAGDLTPLDLGDLYFREVRLVPSYSCGPMDTRMAYGMLRSGAVRPERLITHRFELEQVQEAYDTARRGGEVIKVVVTFPTEGP